MKTTLLLPHSLPRPWILPPRLRSERVAAGEHLLSRPHWGEFRLLEGADSLRPHLAELAEAGWIWRRRKVSVIVPVREDASRLALTLRFLLSQDLSAEDLEILVVENGSQEGLPAFARSHPRVRYFYLAEGNRARARNWGARHAQGEYLAFVDAGTLLPSHALSCFRAELERQPAVSGVQGAHAQDGGMALNLGVNVGTPSPLLDTAACLIRHADFELVAGFDEALDRCEDSDLSYRLIARGAVFASTSTVTVSEDLAPMTAWQALKRQWSVGRNLRRSQWRSSDAPAPEGFLQSIPGPIVFGDRNRGWDPLLRLSQALGSRRERGAGQGYPRSWLTAGLEFRPLPELRFQVRRERLRFAAGWAICFRDGQATFSDYVGKKIWALEAEDSRQFAVQLNASSLVATRARGVGKVVEGDLLLSLREERVFEHSLDRKKR